jgi:hypothetical protein
LAIDAYQSLQSTHPRLVAEVLDKSENISAFLQGCLLHMTELLVDRRRDPRELRYYMSVEGERTLKVQLRWESVSAAMAFEKQVLWRRNPNVAVLMQINHQIEVFPVEVVKVLERWFRYKYPKERPEGVNELRLDNAKAMAPDFMVLQAEIITPKEFDERVKTRLGG